MCFKHEKLTGARAWELSLVCFTKAPNANKEEGGLLGVVPPQWIGMAGPECKSLHLPPRPRPLCVPDEPDGRGASLLLHPPPSDLLLC